jgi:hypothetical protein
LTCPDHAPPARVTAEFRVWQIPFKVRAVGDPGDGLEGLSEFVLDEIALMAVRLIHQNELLVEHFYGLEFSLRQRKGTVSRHKAGSGRLSLLGRGVQ